ncbi:uncharacterized protein LOC133505021 isoform X3 [Syngnathoides biaculeatus]|uniref:uncharacterized protein LOC133505021 isoform X3 n=1 Tax=Syngnathoides biaculeatus TaxID=300417 RepID=UPI002ADE7643|nr:uncharacterized protein LOC133505021 isoform X3 [Syngnathoides biaculeatus]
MPMRVCSPPNCRLASPPDFSWPSLMSSCVFLLNSLLVAALTPDLRPSPGPPDRGGFLEARSRDPGKSAVVRVLEGEAAWLRCPLSRRASFSNLSSSHELLWYRLPPGQHLKEPITHSARLSKEDDMLYFQPAAAEDKGSYVCQLGRCSECVETAARVSVVRPCDLAVACPGGVRECDLPVAVAPAQAAVPLQSGDTLDCPDWQEARRMADAPPAVTWSACRLRAGRATASRSAPACRSTPCWTTTKAFTAARSATGGPGERFTSLAASTSPPSVSAPPARTHAHTHRRSAGPAQRAEHPAADARARLHRRAGFGRASGVQGTLPLLGFVQLVHLVERGRRRGGPAGGPPILREQPTRALRPRRPLRGQRPADPRLRRRGPRQDVRVLGEEPARVADAESSPGGGSDEADAGAGLRPGRGPGAVAVPPGAVPGLPAGAAAALPIPFRERRAPHGPQRFRRVHLVRPKQRRGEVCPGDAAPGPGEPSGLLGVHL